MITRKPIAENYAPIFVEDIITGNDNDDIYCIENTSNRPYRWDAMLTRRDGLDEIVSMFKLNILDINKRGKYYLSFGRTGVSDVEDSTKEKYQDYERKIKSIIEGGHRIKIPFCAYIALTLLKHQREKNVNEKIDISFLYNEYGEEKINYYGKPEFNFIYNIFRKNTVTEIIKIINQNRKEAKKRFSSTKYRKSIGDVIIFCFDYFKEILEKDEVFYNVEIDVLLNLLLKNVYYREEVVLKSNKWEYFDSCNTKGLIVDLTDTVPRAIASKFKDTDKEKVLEEFEKFYQYSIKAENEGKFVPTKNKSDCCEFVLDIAYKKFLIQKLEISSLPNPQEIILDHPKYNIKIGFEKYDFCETIEDALDYFKECYSITDFIYHSMDNNADIYDTYFMFKKEDGNKNAIWWYDILPLYVMYTYFNNSRIKHYLYDYMCKMKAFQFSHKTVARTSNVQNYISSMFKFSKLLLNNLNNEDNIIIELSNNFTNNWLGKMSKQKLKTGLLKHTLDFEYDDIKRILTWNEYIFITKYLVGHETLYKFMSDNKFSVHLDHIIPVKQYNEMIKSEKEVDNSPIGEMVLIEGTLNSSKGDDMTKNTVNYINSGFYLTAFLADTTKRNLKKEALDLIDFNRYSEEGLNNFTIFDVDKRTMYLVDTYVDWIYNVSYEEQQKVG